MLGQLPSVLVDMVNVISALVVLLPDIYQNGSDMLMYPALVKLSSPGALCDQGIHLELRWNTRSVTRKP